jgi:DNA-binding NarL/FixJ family response regulator
MCTVIVGSDDPDRVAELRTCLLARGHDVIVSTRHPTERLVARVAGLTPATLVLQGTVSGSDLRTMARAVETEPRLSILLVGQAGRRLEDLVALAAGISGYLPAGARPDVIADTVNALDSGAILLPRGNNHLVATEAPDTSHGITLDGLDGQPIDLTRREWEVLVLVRQAYSTAEISRRLVVAPVTVRTHVAALLHKLGLHSRRSLVAPHFGHETTPPATK